MAYKKKDPKFVEILAPLAHAAVWSHKDAPEVVHLRNMLKRYKGFSQITSWEIILGQNDYDEMGLPYGEARVTKVIFRRYKQEWSFPA